MKLILENIGMLKHAEITLHKLCVIAGENDNGKSTIGKIFFCIVKAINRYKEDLRESKEFLVEAKMEEIYLLLRYEFRNAATADVEWDFDFLRLELLRDSSRTRMSILERLSALEEATQKFFKRIKPNAKLREKILDSLNEVRAILNEPENINQYIENAFNKVFASEFDSSLLLQGTTKGRIQLTENDVPLIDLNISKKGVKLNGEVEPIALKDATFIDSPLILNNHDVLLQSQTLLDVDQRRSGFLGRPYTTLHTKDLFDKLRRPELPFDLFSQTKVNLLQEIQETIEGEIVYDRSIRDFVFKKRGKPVSIKNTASGIKVFGLLQVLLANEFVANNTALIFDEPENHLHPKWQLRLAQVLIKLVENGVYVLVSSHSPYLIEALKRGVDRVGLTSQARFALAQGQCIDDADRLSDIFKVLSEPFEVFRDMDAKEMLGE